ncbi:hypothetical protein [Yoonia sp. 2307UL14-13]|uniref:hypothetical protein n=1 Tax=Yoonia sp. 2307UL14-13 TaxID=3126506 RepID=UPI003096D9CB
MLIVSAICFVALIILAIIGEGILPIYGGDEQLAARGSKASFALLGGIAFAFAQPAIWGFFADTLQRLVARGDTKSPFADTVLQPGLKSNMQVVGMVLCALFALATLFLSFQLWRGRL